MTVEIEFIGNVPARAHTTDAGFDIAASENCTVPSGERAVVDTGLRVKIPPGYEIQLRSRSGNAAKRGVFLLNSPATIDAGYTGVLKVILFNTSKEDFVVNVGDRIAQLVVQKLPDVVWKPVDAFGDTERGERGLGSTGLSTAGDLSA